MSGDRDLFQQLMSQGHSAAWDRRWEQAAEQYRAALDEFPEDPQAMFSLGLALFELGELDEALQVYRRAIQAVPDDPLPVEKASQILERLGDSQESAKSAMRAAELYLNARDVDKAIENWARVVHLYPDHLAAHSRLALTYERLGRKPQAVREFLAVGSILQHGGRLEEATKTVNHALVLLPDSTEAKQALEMLRTRRLLPTPGRKRAPVVPPPGSPPRQYESAAEPTRPVAVGESLSPLEEARRKALTTLATVVFETPEETPEQPQPSGGLRSITRGIAETLGPSGPDRAKSILYLGKAIDLQTKGQDAQAAEALKRAIASGFEHPAAYFTLGVLLAEEGRRESAERNLQHAVTHAEYGLAARLILGASYLERGDPREAAEHYFEALAMADSSVLPESQRDTLHQLYEPLVEAHLSEGDDESLLRLCRNIAELLDRPNWRMHLLDARKQLPAGGEASMPLPVLEILTQAKSTQVVERISHIEQLARQGWMRTAMEEAYSVLEYAPNYLPLHIQIGELLLREGRTQDAAAKFMIVAKTYGSRGEPKRAINLYRRIVELSPMDLAARTQLIDQLSALGETESALEEYVTLADVYYRLAELEMSRATYQSALRMAQQLNVDSNWNERILRHMADIDMQRLNWRDALNVFRQLSQMSPDDAKIRVSLIELNVRLGQRDQAIAELDDYLSHMIGKGMEIDALAFLEQFVEEHAEMAFAHRRLAEYYQQAARKEEAIEQWSKAGETLSNAGDKEGAGEAYRSILALNPPDADRYRELLRKLEE